MAIPTGGDRRSGSAPRAPAGLPKDRWRRVSWIARNGGAPPGEESRSTRLPGLRPRSDRAMRDRGWTRPKPAGRLRGQIGPLPPTPTIRDRGLSAPSRSAPRPYDPIPRENRRARPRRPGVGRRRGPGRGLEGDPPGQQRVPVDEARRLRLRRAGPCRPGGHRRNANPGLVAQRRQGRPTNEGRLARGVPPVPRSGRCRSGRLST